MAGILSSIFDSGSAEGPSDNKAVVHVSPDDSFEDDGDGTQGTQSFNPGAPDNPNDGGAGDVGGPVGPPSGHPEPYSNEADAGGF